MGQEYIALLSDEKREDRKSKTAKDSALEIPGLVGVMSGFFSRSDLSNAAQVSKDLKKGITASQRYLNEEAEFCLIRLIHKIHSLPASVFDLRVKVSFVFDKNWRQELSKLWETVLKRQEHMPKPLVEMLLETIKNTKQGRLQNLETDLKLKSEEWTLRGVFITTDLITAALLLVTALYPTLDPENVSSGIPTVGGLALLSGLLTAYAGKMIIDEKDHWRNVIATKNLFNTIESDIRRLRDAKTHALQPIQEEEPMLTSGLGRQF